jgi:hypothetical protein
VLRADHIRPAIAFAASGLVLLMLVTSASPAHSRGGPHVGRPRLAISPRRLAAARNIAPGDRIQRLVELRVRGRGRFAAVYFRVRARRRSTLDADPKSGLQIAIQRCSKKWRGRHGVYTCRGRRFVVLARRRFLGRARLRRLGLASHRVAHLRLVLTLPAGAGNSLQAAALRARYSFVGVSARSR